MIEAAQCDPALMSADSDFKAGFSRVPSDHPTSVTKLQ